MAGVRRNTHRPSAHAPGLSTIRSYTGKHWLKLDLRFGNSTGRTFLDGCKQ